MREPEFRKYHGLGNDYLVVERGLLPDRPEPEAIRAICDRNRGVGADGILLFPGLEEGEPRLRIFNPDGSEAEKSGNGLRIFSRYLWERGFVRDRDFHIRTTGGRVRASIISSDASLVSIDMGRPDFSAGAVGLEPKLLGEKTELLDESWRFGDDVCRVTCVSMGNPHCVVRGPLPTGELARRLGPLVEGDALFRNRTNVQFLEVLSPREIRIEIWERGAGYTPASGSSSCAAAAAARRLGLVGDEITVRMPGGSLEIRFIEGSAHMTGPVAKVFEGLFSGELRTELGLANGSAQKG